MKIFPAIPVLLGPTASGKTSVGIALAKKVNGEIISIDSRKVYKGLPIGTATPPGSWDRDTYLVDGIAHHLIGHLDPDQPYNAGDFSKDANRLISEITARGKQPLLVGGTGFYFKALQKGLPILPKGNAEFRNQCSRRIESEGLSALHRELEGVDPEAARAIAPNDPHKIIRALEVLHITGRPFSFWKNNSQASPHLFVVMGLRYDIGSLDKRIEERSKHMAEQGMIEEADAILKKGYSKECPALLSFGYKEAVQVLEGTLNRSDFLPALIKGTKSYAKRQRTWFRTQVSPQWFDCTSSSRVEQIALEMNVFLDTMPST